MFAFHTLTLLSVFLSNNKIVRDFWGGVQGLTIATPGWTIGYKNLYSLCDVGRYFPGNILCFALPL